MDCDDFAFVGAEDRLNALSVHAAARLKVKVAMVGLEHCELLRGLNWGIRLAPEGLVYESDHRHADRLIEELELMSQNVGVTPPLHVSRETQAEHEESTKIQSSSAAQDVACTIGSVIVGATGAAKSSLSAASSAGDACACTMGDSEQMRQQEKTEGVFTRRIVEQRWARKKRNDTTSWYGAAY